MVSHKAKCSNQLLERVFHFSLLSLLSCHHVADKNKGLQTLRKGSAFCYNYFTVAIRNKVTEIPPTSNSMDINLESWGTLTAEWLICWSHYFLNIVIHLSKDLVQWMAHGFLRCAGLSVLSGILTTSYNIRLSRSIPHKRKKIIKIKLYFFFSSMNLSDIKARTVTSQNTVCHQIGKKNKSQLVWNYLGEKWKA